MQSIGGLLACALLIAAIDSTHAQPAAKSATRTFPDRPVRTLVGLPAGGSTDIIVRGLSVRLADAFGQPFVVDNRPGASGLIALDLLASAAPDGHTLMAVGGTSILYPLLYKSRYDILRDFAPVAQLTAQGYVLVIHPSLPANSVPEFVQYLKANPDKVNYSSSGIGSPLHMSGELFKLNTGTRMIHVPYKGTAPAYADLLGGQVQTSFPTIISSLVHIKAGRLRALAVTAPKRVQAVPSVPTFDETGVKGMTIVNWYGLIAPKKTPQPIIDRLVGEINEAMNSPEMVKSLTADGAEAASGSSADFAAHLKSENERWSRVVKAVGMKVDLR
jgi:tripartite-type tricarboxylate transporter receptor subunit TctC